MAVWDKKILWSFMILLTGAVGQPYTYPGNVTVNYPGPVCSVKGSTVTLHCTFTPHKSFIKDGREYPLRIIRVVWCKNHEICHGSTPSVYDSESDTNNPRYQYLGDKKGNCTLQIRDIQREDNAKFRFRMEVNYTVGHYTKQSGVEVTVIDDPQMTIISSRNQSLIREGQTETLLCISSCSFHQLEVTWFRDDHALSESGPALQLGPLTAEDSGNYTCGLKTNSKTRSRLYELRVEAAEEGESDKVSLIVGVVFGVLLALGALILGFFIFKRKQEADKDQRNVGGDVGQKSPDNLYSNILPHAEPDRLSHPQETGRDVEEISYAAVQFKHKNQARYDTMMLHLYRQVYSSYL
uniref:Ig-like domain-containing protein n=1 Tax=Lates calcarifer TaxID=8187 RepID=A0A4W6BW87_LATCA